MNAFNLTNRAQIETVLVGDYLLVWLTDAGYSSGTYSLEMPGRFVHFGICRRMISQLSRFHRVSLLAVRRRSLVPS